MPLRSRRSAPPRFRPAVAPAAALLLALAAACSADGADPVQVAMSTDSTGIPLTVVSGLADAELPAWTVSTEPRATIGGARSEPEHQLHDVRHATRLADGRILLAHGGGHDLRLYAADGTHLRTVGRKGKGPGEFEFPTWAGAVSGDSILAYDQLQRRMVLFTAGGDHVRSVPLPAPDAELPLLPEAVGVLTGGRFVATPGFDRIFTKGARRDTMAVLLYDAALARIDTVGVFPAAERYFVTTPQMSSMFEVGFGRDLFVAARGNRIVVGSSDAHELALHDADGRLVRRVRVTDPLRPVPEAAVARWRAGLGEGMPPQFRAGIPFDEIPAHDSYPAFDGLAVDPAGGYWVRIHPDSADAPERWTAFSDEGRPLGRVTLPPRFALLEIGADYVLGRWRDEEGVQAILLHDLTRVVP